MKKTTKSLFTFITERMEELKNNQISTDEAFAHAALAKQAIHCMVIEINKAQVLLEIEQTNSKVKLKEVGDTAFQETIKILPQQQPAEQNAA